MQKTIFDELKFKDKVRIMFVCHGNICRSPMAEFVFTHMADKRGTANRFVVKSAATSYEECGRPPYSETLRVLTGHGVPTYPRRAVRLDALDADKYDIFLGMDKANISDMRRILGGGVSDKILRLKDAADIGGDVDDPWYTNNFEICYSDISAACKKLLDKI
jgi:protein-tyrosine phosphatase